MQLGLYRNTFINLKINYFGSKISQQLLDLLALELESDSRTNANNCPEMLEKIAMTFALDNNAFSFIMLSLNFF